MANGTPAPITAHEVARLFRHVRFIVKRFVKIFIVLFGFVDIVETRRSRMALMQIHESLLIDRDALVFVRFENMDQDPTAVLKFKDGSAETVTGDAARHLQQHLNSSEAEQHREAPEMTDAPVQAVRQPAPRPTVASVHFADGRSATVPHSVPFIGRNKAWFRRKDENGREYILAFVNAKGSCSLRTFDETGIFLGKHYRSGNYQDQFADLLAGAIELTVNSQPNLERDCKERLPAPLLSYLRDQSR